MRDAFFEPAVEGISTAVAADFQRGANYSQVRVERASAVVLQAAGVGIKRQSDVHAGVHIHGEIALENIVQDPNKRLWVQNDITGLQRKVREEGALLLAAAVGQRPQVLCGCIDVLFAVSNGVLRTVSTHLAAAFHSPNLRNGF